MFFMEDLIQEPINSQVISIKALTQIKAINFLLVHLEMPMIEFTTRNEFLMTELFLDQELTRFLKIRLWLVTLTRSSV